MNTTQPSNNLSGIDGSSTALRPDDSRISSFAQMVSALQQLQQSDPTKYKQVTEQIATDLRKAATAARSEGSTTAANQLNQLSKDFSDASKNGELPSIQALAHAARGHHGHHHSRPVFADSDASRCGYFEHGFE